MGKCVNGCDTDHLHVYPLPWLSCWGLAKGLKLLRDTQLTLLELLGELKLLNNFLANRRPQCNAALVPGYNKAPPPLC